MFLTLLEASVFGAIVLFIWQAISWRVLPWHRWILNTFKDEGAVADALARETSGPGVYSLPCAFVAFRPGGLGSMAVRLGRSFLIQLLASALVSYMLIAMDGSAYWDRVGLTILFALAAGVVCRLPDWNWWAFSPIYTIISMLDLLMGWFLAGLVIAKITS